MNFKFEEDFDKNLLKLTVSIEPRRSGQEREIHGWGTIQELMSEYKCAATHILGECLDPVQAVDNETVALSATWHFHLTPKKAAPKTAPVAAASTSTRTTKKTTSRKKRKSSEV